MAERVLIFHQDLVKEGVLRIDTVAKDHVAEFMGEHGGQAGFIGQHVDQTAAQHNGVAYGERFQGRSHQHAAANFRVEVDVVGDLKVVDDGFQNLVHVTLRRHQANALQAVRDVVFGLAVPGALRLDRRKVIGGLGVVLNRRLYEDLAEFLLLSGVAKVVAP